MTDGWMKALTEHIAAKRRDAEAQRGGWDPARWAATEPLLSPEDEANLAAWRALTPEQWAQVPPDQLAAFSAALDEVEAMAAERMAAAASAMRDAQEAADDADTVAFVNYATPLRELQRQHDAHGEDVADGIARWARGEPPPEAPEPLDVSRRSIMEVGPEYQASALEAFMVRMGADGTSERLAAMREREGRE